jgi:Divergent InlB B-repeat domain
MKNAFNNFLAVLAAALALSACGAGSQDAAVPPQTADLTVQKAGSGTVTSASTDIDCGTKCNVSVPVGTIVELSATAASGYSFVGWSGSGISCSGTGTCALTLDVSSAVTATFSQNSAPQYDLAVTVAGSGTVVSNPAGVNCPGDCSGPYASGTVVTLTAAPATGFTFTGWSGSGLSCSGLTCPVTMSSARSVTATFTAIPPASYTLTVSVSGSGTVVSLPAGINNCTGTCNASFVGGTPVTLAATPASGFSFTGWNGAGCSGTNTCDVTMSAARSVSAAFAAVAPNTAALNTVVTGSGTVVSSPAGINCPTDCAETLNVGTSVTLTAAPASGYSFGGWAGGCSGTSLSCTVTLTGATTVSAQFNLVTYNLTVTKTGLGTVTSAPTGISCGATCSATYPASTSVTLTAAPASGYTFSAWSNGCTGTATTCVVAMSAAKTVAATFTATPTFALTVSTTAGSGSISSSPSGISCGTTCTASFNSGTGVTLTATPASGYAFSSWGGACSGASTCSVTMSSAQSVTAAFVASPTTGNSYFVSTTGSDTNSGLSLTAPLRTLNHAVDLARAGDVIEVRAGSYTEAVVIRTAGTASAWITMRGYNGERPVIRRTGAGPTVYFYNDLCDENTVGTASGNTDCLASYWVLQGLEIRGSQGGGGDGNVVKIDTAKVRLQGNKLCCSEADVVKLVRTANDIEVLDNEIWQDSAITTPSVNAQGVDIVGADRTRVAGNYVHNVPDLGMYAKGNARNTLFENNLLVNIGRSDNGHAIMLGQETDEERLVDGVFESYDGIVRNNVVVNATWACVAVSSSSNARVYNNSCYNTGTAGHGSIFLSNESIIGTKSANIEVVNNIIYGSASRPVIKVTADALAAYSTFRVSNNIYYVTGGAPTFQPNSDNGAISFSQWLTQYTALSGRTDNSRVIDPLFSTTTGSTPLTLLSTSPAINTGASTTLVTKDFRGVARPAGGQIDVGAYEY